MNEAVLKEKLLELSESMIVPIAGASKPGSDGVYTPASQSTLDESMDYLRLQIKYLLFDLEATRRENRYLRQMLENRPGREGKDSDDSNPGNP
jgi:hypothetical protein